MICPRCTDRTDLSEVVKQGVTLDTCPSCSGIWLDKGELAKLLGQARNAEAELDRELAALHSKTARGALRPPVQAPQIEVGKAL